MHRSPGIYLTAEEIPVKNSTRPSMKALRPVIASNGAYFFQMRSVGSHSMSVWEKEGKKERTLKKGVQERWKEGRGRKDGRKRTGKAPFYRIPMLLLTAGS